MPNFMQGMQRWGAPQYFPGSAPPIRGAGVPASWPAPTTAPNGRLIPTGASAPVGPAWLNKFNTGFGRFLGGMGGGPNPYLNPQEQAYDQQQRNMAMISALIGASGPKPKGTTGLLQPFGEAMMAGQAAGQSSFDNLMRYRDQTIRQQQVQQNQRLQQQATDPAAVREYEYFQKLDPEQQRQYLTVKRNQPGIEIQEIPQADGSSKMVLFDPSNGSMYELTPSGVRGVQSATGQPAQLPSGAGTTRTPEAERTAILQAEGAVAEVGEDESRLEARQEVAAAAQSALDNPNLNRAGGAIQGLFPAISQRTVDARADISQVVALLSLESRDKLKGSGQISDYESRLLGQSATVLSDPRISDQRRREELQKVVDILNGSPQAGTESSFEGFEIVR